MEATSALGRPLLPHLLWKSTAASVQIQTTTMIWDQMPGDGGISTWDRDLSTSALPPPTDTVWRMTLPMNGLVLTIRILETPGSCLRVSGTWGPARRPQG